MDELDLRQMIRESIARHMGGRDDVVRGASLADGPRAHASHVLLPLHRGSEDGDGVCLIEPSVRCNHCGYCVSYGH